MEKRAEPAFNSAMTKKEAIAAIAYLPVHIILLPAVLGALVARGVMAEVWANFTCYAVGAAYMLALEGRFLRRDFDALCDRPFFIIVEVVASYALLLACNFVMSLALVNVPVEANPNNESVIGLIMDSFGPMAAAAVFLAPILEELIFRAGIFGLLRRRSRLAAYCVSATAFALYHVWGYAAESISYLIYIVQYIPPAILLARCYERTDSIWGSIFLHMLTNGVSVRAVLLLQELGAL